MRAFAIIVLLVLLSGIAVPQATEPKLKFDVADIHTAPQSDIRFPRGGALHGNRYELRNASMVDLISTAYGVDPDKVFGGPSWLEFDRYDVIALAPAKTPKESVDLMLQSLLEERFKLVAQPETKPVPAYAITQGKHLTIKESDGSGEPGCKQSFQGLPSGPPPVDGGPMVMPTITIVLTCRNTSLESFAQELPIPRRQGEFKPILDQTGLKGTWNFEFKFSLGGGPIGPANDTSSISDALDKQLGLKLEPITTPAPVIDVKSVMQKPTPNSDEAMKAFPPLPAEFDVAEIKPFKPDSDGGPGGGMVMMKKAGGISRGGRGGQQLQNGRLNLQGYTLKQLITLAWDLRNENMVAGGPKWMDSDRFTVIAKVPGGPAADAFTDIDSIKPMLRTLLTQQFKMTVHNEDRQLPGYVLTANKPKLKKADPAGRTRWMNGPGPDGKDPRNGNMALGRLIVCQNMTMAQFADLLPGIAPGVLRGESVVDQTGLEGAWDFTFYFSPAGMMDGGRGGVRVVDGSPAGAPDPSAGIPLPDALNKLLGIKMEMQKRNIPVLVIDKVDQTPSEN